MHPQTKAVDAYRREAFENAPPLKLVRLLYQGAIRFLREAEELNPKDERVAFIERANRADAIVMELRCSLETDAAPELVEQLETLYLFAEERISTAIMDLEPTPLAEARQVLEVLLEGWRGVEMPPAGAA